MGAATNKCTPEAKSVLNRCGLLSSEGRDSQTVLTFAGQDHVYTFAGLLTENEQKTLEDQMVNIDIDLLAEQLEKASERGVVATTQNYRQPNMMSWLLKKPPKAIPGTNVTSVSQVRPHTLTYWKNLGYKRISTGTVAVVILAGGTGLLGFPSVGMVDMGLPSRKSMFQIFCERVLRIQQLCMRFARNDSEHKREIGAPELCCDNVIMKKKTLLRELADDQEYVKSIDLNNLDVPVYVMANPSNREDITAFFAAHNYFGLKPGNVVIFTQREVPVVNKEGKILLKEKGSIWCMPEGNGGLFHAMRANSVFSDMKSRGVTGVYVAGCNNLLARIADPLFIGYNTHMQAQVGVKSVERVLPEEDIRMILNRSKRVYKDQDGDGDLDEVEEVVPVSFLVDQIDDDMLRQRDENNKLFFETGDLGQYWFTLPALSKLSRRNEQNFNFHLSRVRAPYVSIPGGDLVDPPPGEKNGLYLEMYIADVLEMYQRVPLLTVDRKSELAFFRQPDDLPSALNTFCSLCQSWLHEVGSVFLLSRTAGYARDTRCEISPLVTYDGEDLYGLHGTQLGLPLYIKACGEVVLDDDSNAFDEGTIFGARQELLTLTTKTLPIGGLKKGVVEVQFKPIHADDHEVEDCESSQRLCGTPVEMMEDGEHWVRENSIRQQAYYDKIAKRKLEAEKRNEMEEERLVRMARGESPTAPSGKSKSPRSPTGASPRGGDSPRGASKQNSGVRGDPKGSTVRGAQRK